VEDHVERLPVSIGLFVLALLVGLLVVLIVPAMGASDWVTFPTALAVIVGVFALCIRVSTPGPRRRGTFAGRAWGVRLYRTGPSPSLEEVAQQLEEGARRRRRGRMVRKRGGSHGKPRRR
jgi:hypothetical protein